MEQFEKVGRQHPDVLADRIAGRLVDYAYSQQRDPRIAVEVQIGHGLVTIIAESSVPIPYEVAVEAVEHIAGRQEQIILRCVEQDPHLASNQADGFRCGDNGIARGCPITPLQRELTALVKTLDANFQSDCKAVLTDDRLIVCQSNATHDEVFQCICEFKRQNGYGKTIIGRLTPPQITINPLGEWTGGPLVDTGCTNRKLGSALGDAVTGGGLAGKDLSKFDVSGTIVCHIKAQALHTTVEATCAIGDDSVVFRHRNTATGSLETETLPFADIVEQARLYILTDCDGSFERFAEWGLIR